MKGRKWEGERGNRIGVKQSCQSLISISQYANASSYAPATRMKMLCNGSLQLN